MYVATSIITLCKFCFNFIIEWGGESMDDPDVDVTSALKDPTNLSASELEEIEKAQLTAVRKVKALLGTTASPSAENAEKKLSKKTRRRVLLNIKNRI